MCCIIKKRGGSEEMKKALVGLGLLLGTYMFGDNALEYSRGMEAYKHSSYAQSYKLLKKIYLQHLDDADFNFIFGRSAFQSGHYEMALAAFERVLMQRPYNLRNKVELGKTYYMLKMYEDATIVFEEVLENPNLPDNMRTNIELLLARVAKVQQKSFTYARINANYFYDSNINYGSLGDYQYGGLNLAKVEEVSDQGFDVLGSITNIYDLGSKNGFAIKNNIVAYLKEYSAGDKYDVEYFGYTPSVLYAQPKYTLELALGGDILRFGGELLVRSLSVSPKGEWKHSATLKSLFVLEYRYKEYIPEVNKNLSARHYAGSYALQKILSSHSYLQGMAGVISERKVRGSNTNVSFDEIKLNVAYANQMTQHYSIELMAQVRQRDFRDYDSGFDNTRQDRGGIAKADFGVRLLPTLRWSVAGSYEYVKSNQGRYSYEKYILSTGLNKTF